MEWNGMECCGLEDKKHPLYMLTCSQNTQTSAYKGATGSHYLSIYKLTVTHEK